MSQPFPPEALSALGRRREVAKLRMKGMTQEEIADIMKVSQPTISNDLKEIKKMWRKDCVDTVEDMRIESAIRLRSIQAEAWMAWERSQGDKESKSIKDDGTTKEKAVRSDAQFGDPRFLELARKTEMDFVELFGIAMPTKIDLNDVSNRPTGQLKS